MTTNLVTPAHLARARRQVEDQFRMATAHVGDVPHRMNPPLEVEEALDPALDWPWKEPIHQR